MNILNLNHGPLNSSYLNRIVETLHCSLSEHPRTMAVRIDLRLPDITDPNSSMDVDSPSHFMAVDQKVISRFFASLQAQIKHDLNCKRIEGKRVHPCSVRYVWVRECSAEFKWHYHVVLLLNQGASTLCSLINQRTIEHDNRHSNLLSSVYFVGLAHRIHSA